MKALIIYDSTYGNTEKIAKALGGAIPGEIKVVSVGEASPSDLGPADLVIIGSPTQGFQPTKPVQAFLQALPDDALKGKNVAAFDTRIPTAEVGKVLRQFMKIGGYAAPRIAKALEKKGGNMMAPPEGFCVDKKEGPLKEGEVERAAAWTKELVK